MNCIRHSGVALVPSKTKYGIKYQCPVQGCTVACWDGSTSTPVDIRTRKARIAAHDSFDAIWKSGMFKRKEAYRRLSEYLKINPKDCHIGMFDLETANKTHEFADKLANPEIF